MFKQLSSAAVLGFTGVMTWHVLDTMSADALAMAVGVVLGIGAGLPVAVLIVAGQRRRSRDERRPHHEYGFVHERGSHGYAAFPAGHGAPPPVVVIAPPGYAQGHALSGAAFHPTMHGSEMFNHARSRRRFVVVGQTDGDGGNEEW